RNGLKMLMIVLFGFFFSSRRRHTRCYRDWSSDVCSSDLGEAQLAGAERVEAVGSSGVVVVDPVEAVGLVAGAARAVGARRAEVRSEERRVGKEGRNGGWQTEGMNRYREMGSGDGIHEASG